MFFAITVFVSVTGLVEKIPPPCNVMAELPPRTLPVMVLLIRVGSPPGGPLGD
jgi:hypothetical protein